MDLHRPGVVIGFGMLLASLALSGLTLRAQAVGRADDVSSVDSFEALRPTTPGERIRAAYFKRSLPEGRSVEELWAAGLSISTSGGPPIVRAGVDTVIQGQNFAEEEIRRLRERERRALVEEHRQDICSMPMVFIGHVESAKVLVNLEGTWLFTDFTVVVDRWIHRRDGGRQAPSPADQHVTLSWFGGEVQVAGRTVGTFGPSPLPHLNERNVFLTREIPAGGGYVGSLPQLHDGVVTVPVLGLQLVYDDYVAELSRMSATCQR